MPVILTEAHWDAWLTAGAATTVYRFWRGLGYAAGALAADLLADRVGLTVPIIAIGGLMFLSGIVVALVNRKTRG